MHTASHALPHRDSDADRVAHHGRAPTTTSPDFAWRVLSLLNGYRILAVLLLLALFYLGTNSRGVGHTAPLVFLASAFLYLLFAVGCVYLINRRSPPLAWQLYGQTGIDVTAIMVLMAASGGIESGLGNLLVVSIGAASILVDRRMVGVLPAIAAIALLGAHGIARLDETGASADSMPTGLLGATLFVIALAAHPLAARLRESEALARQRGVDLANMAELNHYIIQHLRESLIVVDGDDRVRLVNGAAKKALELQGATRGRPLAELSRDLHAVVGRWRTAEEPAEGGGALAPLRACDGATTLVPHVAPLGHGHPAALLIFLEDQSLLAERMQQSKLAALGRLSASIAHEIRNPVGAMSHAAQLLAESSSVADGDRRLTDIIHDNAMRISRIVDNVLQLSRPGNAETVQERFELPEWIEAFAAEFRASYQLAPPALRVAHERGSLPVRMDPSHLHQVVWNLCDNALKYGAPDAKGTHIAIQTGRVSSNGRPYVQVSDFGAGIDEQDAERIFEPFFTSHHGGTGLGLFIARQLCECSGAALVCLPEGPGAVFRIVFTDPQRWTTERNHEIR
jgi:two-component system sensor histidine kinase PilS (NtrC family)